MPVAAFRTTDQAFRRPVAIVPWAAESFRGEALTPGRRGRVIESSPFRSSVCRLSDDRSSRTRGRPPAAAIRLRQSTIVARLLTSKRKGLSPVAACWSQALARAPPSGHAERAVTRTVRTNVAGRQARAALAAAYRRDAMSTDALCGGHHEPSSRMTPRPMKNSPAALRSPTLNPRRRRAI